MSKRQKSFFKITVIIPWIIMICIVFSLQMQCENGDQEKPKREALSAEKVLQMEMKFNNDLQQKVFTHLKDRFNGRDYKGMAERLVEYHDKISLYDLTGKKMIEEQEIINFWAKAAENRVTELDFTILSLRVIPVAEPIELEPPNNENTIIATGHAVFVYRLIKNTGTAVTNQIGSGSYNSPHPSRCEW